ncbi:MAG: cation:proton antiporter [Gemmatimonadetes bacterium]|nr:cation:proton antiporter [Gemmatimonadota bacterium]
MTDFPIIHDLGAILLSAAAMLVVARQIRVPAILAYIAAGLLLGPVTGFIEVTESVDLIAEVGIALLLFLVGLELSLDRIRDVGRVALGAGTLQIVLTTLLGFAVVAALGYGGAEAWILALAITFSSTVVVVRILHAQRALRRVDGRIAIGILLVQDVAVAITLTIVAAAASSAGDGRALPGLLRAATGLAALIGFAFVSVRWLLPPALRWLSSSLEVGFVAAIAWCFLFIAVSQRLGLSVEIGAFMAGVTIAQCAVHGDLVRRVHPLVNLFVAVFFVALGIHVDLASAAAGWPVALAVAAVVLVGKPILVGALVRAFGYGDQTAFRTGIALGQMSEFAFILGALAVSTELIRADTFSILAAAGIGTIAISAVLIPASDRLWSLVERAGIPVQPGIATHVESQEVPLRGHFIVVGMNALGRRLVTQLVERREEVLAIDADAAKLEGLPGHHLAGSTDHLSVLESARLVDARLLISALQIEDANNLLAWRARLVGVPTAIHAFDAAVVPDLQAIGVDYVMVSKHDGIRQIAAELRRVGVID